jgi:hypothetical protein
MRHRVRHSTYDEFVPHKAEPSVNAARTIIALLGNAIAKFKKTIDPDLNTRDKDGCDGTSGGASGGPPV